VSKPVSVESHLDVSVLLQKYPTKCSKIRCLPQGEGRETCLYIKRLYMTANGAAAAFDDLDQQGSKKRELEKKE
jgi:hypothetical protein